MVTYAICRIQKIKSWESLAGRTKHSAREKETLNANPNIKNIRLIDQDNKKSLKTLFVEKIGEQTIRSNAVLGIEMVLSASPQFFRPDNPTASGFYVQELADNFAAASSQWLLDRYQDRVLRADLHLDESTPHIHAFIVPIDHRGRLNSRALFNGRKQMSELQESFANAVKHLGIERGIKGSKAKHTDIKKYYTAVNCKSVHINLEDVLPAPGANQTAEDYRSSVKEILQPQLDTLNHQLADREFKLREEKRLEKTAQASERERKKLQDRLQNIEWTIELWQAQAHLLRDLPLEDVAYHLGLFPDPSINNRWVCEGHTVNIIGSRFYDFVGKQHGGGGAIDLVMHLLNCSFREAVVWLHDTFGESGMLRALVERARNEAEKIIDGELPQNFAPPQPDESRWLDVSDYLTKTRKLPSSLIGSLHSEGLIYSDAKKNAVFLMRSFEEEVTGAFLRGTHGENNSFYGLAKGSKRNKGWFHMTVGGQESDKISRAVLAKSPIEALSIAVLDKEKSQKTIYIAVDSPRCLPIEFLTYIPNLVAAYHNNASGQEIFLGIQKILPQITRLKPKAEDWNQQLVQYGSRFNIESDL
ncbi:MAG: plasmid recombination protein [Scytonematopsis contorta HA4267-MV1]|jgi:hypothetical protein|nr:plasmid recombination protein [Scytonematopsis contorta HA4267-MV1]